MLVWLVNFVNEVNLCININYFYTSIYILYNNNARWKNETPYFPDL